MKASFAARAYPAGRKRDDTVSGLVRELGGKEADETHQSTTEDDFEPREQRTSQQRRSGYLEGGKGSVSLEKRGEKRDAVAHPRKARTFAEPDFQDTRQPPRARPANQLLRC